MNSSAFTPEEVKQGLHLDLINYLLDYNSKSETHYNDIHVTTDGYCTIVEWEQTGYEFNIGNFKFVDEEHEVLKEVIFPDNHIEYLHDEEEKEAKERFLEENPEYKSSIIY